MTGKTSPEVIRSLIEKVEAGSGRDIGLDRKLEALWWPKDVPQWESNGALAKYTSSIDAAVALTEKLLPGWWIESMGDSISATPDTTKFLGASVELSCYADKLIPGQAETRPRALLSATLRALLAKMEDE